MRVLVVALCLLASPALAQLRVATFECDASPPVGSPMAYDPTIGVDSPLSCRGLVIMGAGQPIVLCSVDWLGIANASHAEFCERLAKAAGTTADRVSVHTIHQHDAPRCDFSAKEYLDQVGLGDATYDERFCRSVMLAASHAVAGATVQTTPVTHVGIGEAIVEKVASNRQILGEDGKVKFTRYTACRDPKIRAMPVGTIDPSLKMVSFWNGDKPVAVLTYYATHPQSYYRTGEASTDFPGIARNNRQKETGVPHIHFNGAGGNVGAGKWNDGAKENRQVLADRVALAMKQAWEATTKTAVSAEEVAWKSLPVVLPAGKHLVEDTLVARLKDDSLKQPDRLTAAKHLAWLKRTEAKTPVNLSLLSIGQTRVLHMPGELFVEYQLAAQEMVPDNFVAMAAYGEYGTGYIGTRVAYSQGGYETSERASRVSSDVEDVLLNGVKKLLKEPHIKLRGEVYDGDEDGDEDPIEGVLIRALSAPDQFSKPVELARCLTDSDGEFQLEFTAQPVGDFSNNEFGFCWLIATHPKYSAQSYAANGWSKHMTKYQTWPLYPRNRVFHGVVRDEAGMPISGAVVHFSFASAWVIPGGRNAATNADGEFRMEGLYSPLTEEEEAEREAKPTGWSYVSVSHPDYGKQTFKHVTYKSPVDWTLKRPAILKGSVVDAMAGKPAANTTVWFGGKDNNSASARTNAAGEFEALLSPDVYRISVRTPDRACNDLIRDLKPGANGRLLPIRLTAGAIVSGRIVDEKTDGRFEAATNKKFQVWADGPEMKLMGGSRRYRSTRVRPDGTFEIRLPAGQHRFRLAPRNIMKSVMTLEDGEKYEVDFVVGAAVPQSDLFRADR